MREGISRDGSHLYPVFPYTAFTRTSDDDLQALYAYLMSRPAVSAATPQARLAFPMNIRPLMAGWNLLFHRPGAYQPDPTRSAEWNRGAYLVEGLGHCGGCHTPRNALGAEIASKPLAGGWAEGWEAPPLGGLSHAPIPWSEAELYTYLRTGFSALHGPAAGSMGPVVREMAALPDADLRAMAHYLASLGPAVTPEAEAARAAEISERSAGAMLASAGPGARLYQGACAACHEPGALPQFGVQPNLAFNTNLQSARPDNLIRTILEGIQAPARDELGAMPGFAQSLTDEQIADLVGFLRRHYAPNQQPWSDLRQAVARLRASAPGS
jgi:nicotinate dehydrogenase subunit B